MSASLPPPPPRPGTAAADRASGTAADQDDRSNDNTLGSIVKKNAYVEGLVRTAPTLSYEHVKAAIINMPHDSCVRKSFLWGLGVGALFGLHRFKQGGTVMRSIRSACLGLSFTFVTQFYFCRRQEFDTKVAMRKFMADQQQGSSAAAGSHAKIGAGDEDYDDGDGTPLR